MTETKALPTIEDFTISLLNAVIDMRDAQKEFFRLRNKNHLPINDPRVITALNDSKELEKYVDELIQAATIPKPTILQAQLF